MSAHVVNIAGLPNGQGQMTWHPATIFEFAGPVRLRTLVRRLTKTSAGDHDAEYV
jgi:hypothetical protein